MTINSRRGKPDVFRIRQGHRTTGIYCPCETPLQPEPCMAASPINAIGLRLSARRRSIPIALLREVGRAAACHPIPLSASRPG